MSGTKKVRRTSLIDRVAVASSKNKAARASTVYDAIENQTINNIDDSDGLAPMHRLCAGSSSNCAELIMQLANAGADLNVLDSEGDTPLHFACFEGNVPAVETLLNFEQTDCTIRNKRGKTPMDLARNEGEEKILEMLQKHLQKRSMSGQDIESEQPPPPPVPTQLSLAEIRSRDASSSSASSTPVTPRRISLATAASKGDIDLVLEVLKNASVDINERDKDGFTPLHRAAAQPNSHTIIQALIDNGADVRAIDAFGDTALHWAAFCGHLDSAKTLIENGAEATVANSEGKTALDAALEEDHHAIASLIKKFQDGQTGLKRRGQRGPLRENLKVKTKDGVLKKTRWPQRLCVLDQRRGELAIFQSSSSFGSNNMSISCKDFVHVRGNQVKKVGLRFDLRTVSGTVHSFIAETPKAAETWIMALREAGGKNMKAIIIQRQFRRHRVRKRYKGKLKTRTLGTKLLSSASTFSESLKKSIEGVLLKKDDIKHGRVARLFRKRYFVLFPETGFLTYFDNKAKRMLNLKGKKKNRDIPISKFLSVTWTGSRGGTLFSLALTSGRTYELMAQNKVSAKKWVDALRASLPAENYAAYKIQSVIRMRLTRRKFMVLIQAHREVLKKQKEAAEAKAAEEARKKISAEEMKRQKEERRLKRLERLKRLQEVQDAKKKSESVPKPEKTSKSATLVERMKRLKALKAAKKRKAEEDAAAKKREAEEDAAASKKLNVDEESTDKSIQIWVYTIDANTGRDYYFNAETKETSWELPQADGDYVWVAKKDEATDTYYYINLASGETRWDNPAAMDSSEDSEDDEDDEVDPNMVIENWRILVDQASERKYFLNIVTQATSWEIPDCLLGDWRKVVTSDGKVYYHNTVTNETSWTPPDLQNLEILMSGVPAALLPDPYDRDEDIAFGKILEELHCRVDDNAGEFNQSWRIECIHKTLLAKLLNYYYPDVIDMRALNVIDQDDYEDKSVVENIHLIMGAAKSVGAIYTTTFDVQKCADLDACACIEFVYPILNLIMTKTISLKSCPSLILLGHEDEDEDKSIQMVKSYSKEQLLVKWLNYHAARNGMQRSVTDISNDLADGELILNVLRVTGDRDVVEEDTILNTILATVRKRRCATWMKLRYIEGGNRRLLGLFCAALFSHDHALEFSEKTKAVVEKAAMLEEEDPTQTKEYRTYKMWLNSIIPYIEGASSVVDIMEDLRDGVLLVQILNVISEGTLVIKWKKDINLKPKNRYHKVENVNFAIKLCQELGFNLHNIAGLDILDCKDPKLLYAILWKCLRYHSLTIVSKALGIKQTASHKDIDESQIIEWANAKCEDNGCTGELETFKDPELATSVFFMDLLEAIEPGIVDWEVLRGVESAEDRKHNAQYVISVARKLGCPVFLTWEDIIGVNKNMLMTLVANLMVMDMTKDAL